MQGGSSMAARSTPDSLSPAQLESDAFKIFCYKIVPCAKKFGHDWSECPFAHDGEKATRRCPALYLYSSIVCPDVRQSKPCPRGDVCPYSHSIFEYWMHPARFRAQMCSFGSQCNRRICFFAHAQDQLRIPNDPSVADALAARAPYLQGRVCPKSRYALYLEQVPPTLTGVLPQTLVSQDATFAPQELQQVVRLPAGSPAAGPMQYGTACGPVPGTQQAPILQQQQQQWTQGDSMMYVHGGLTAGAPGIGYHRPARRTMAAGSLQPSMGQLQLVSGAMVVPQAGLQLGAPAGDTYSSTHGGQMVVAVGPDGSILRYPVAAAPGSMMTYVQPAMYTSVPPALPSPMQQPWVVHEGQMQAVQQHMHTGQQQTPQQLQLVQGVQQGDSLPQPGAHEQLVLGQPPAPFRQVLGQPPAPFRQAQSTDSGGYAVLPAGAPVVNPPGRALPAMAHPREGGPSAVDDLTQQIGGWQIT